MVRQNPKTVFQVIVEAAVNLWMHRQTLHAMGNDDTGSRMAWWDMIRRWASTLAFRLGRIAIYAESKYDKLKVN